MKKARNILLALLCALLLVAGSVAGTLAYLTSNGGTVTNTFTAGNVTITMDEAKVNEYGLALDENDEVITDGDAVPADRVTANSYKLIPGHEYIKDPTIHVDKDSESCYLFVKVTNGIADIEAEGENGTIETQLANNGWVELEGETGVYYLDHVATAEENAALFTGFTVDTDADVASYASENITVIAYAVQADGFNSAEEAWEGAPSSWGESADTEGEG